MWASGDYPSMVETWLLPLGPRLVEASGIGPGMRVLDVAAGTGNASLPAAQAGADVTASDLTPDLLEAGQRRADAAGLALAWVEADAENLPFEDESFDAAMAIATVHHWRDPLAGLREMQRVAGRVVVFTFDFGGLSEFWLSRDYLPELLQMLSDHPSLAEQAAAIGARIEPVMIPWDCVDGFFEAYWRRPEAYLDEGVRRGISTWAKLGPEIEQRAVRRLQADLASGRWAERNRDLIDLEAADLGLRLLIA
jgi:SAM-dependent methyltransferase